MKKPGDYNRLLGGLTPKDFLKTYWQKKPLLVRKAFPDFKDLLSPDQLAGLAMEPDCKARLVFEKGRKPWRVLHGPFEEKTLTSLPKTHWSLLVSRVNEYLDSAAGMLECFNFIPRWRTDDLMVSFAPPHGTVGPHVDSYDVFLIQGMGRRSWQINPKPDPAIIEGVDLRVLKHFTPTAEWVLEPGDMLYLPPGVAHYGRALEDCMTYSVGFRAPSNLGILSDLFNTPQSWFSPTLTHEKGLEILYTDPDLLPCKHPGLVDSKAIEALSAVVRAQVLEPDFLNAFMLRHLTKTEETPVFAAKLTPKSLESWRQKLKRSTLTRSHRFPISYIAPKNHSFPVAVGGHLWELNQNLLPLLQTITTQQTMEGQALLALIPDQDARDAPTHKATYGERISGIGFLYQLARCGAVTLGVILCLALWGGASRLDAAEIVPPGIESKLSAGGGQTTVTGPSSLFFNPANLAISGTKQLDFDLGVARYEYRYQHTDQTKYRPVSVADTAPPLGLSFAFKPLETLTVGFTFLPTGVGTKQIIIDIPLDLGEGIYQLADVESTASGSKLGVGVAYRVSPRLLIGLSVQRLQEKTAVSIFKAADVYPFLTMENQGVFYLPALGLRTDFGVTGLGVGFSYRPAVVKRYKGRFLFDLIGDDQKNGVYKYFPLNQIDLVPQTLGLGVQWRGAPWGGFLDLTHEAWTKGGSDFSRGLPIASKGAELKDALNAYVGGEYRWKAGTRIAAAYGYQPGNLGNGDKRKGPGNATAELPLVQEAATKAATLEGMSFGNTSGIPLNLWSLGYQHIFAKGAAWTPAFGAITFYAVQGRRTVPQGFSQEGTYSLRLMMLALGGAWRF